jgi:hypothetical protein
MTKILRAAHAGVCKTLDGVQAVFNAFGEACFAVERATGLALANALQRENTAAQTRAGHAVEFAAALKRHAVEKAKEANALCAANAKAIRNLRADYA